jgi:hypothetical protein
MTINFSLGVLLIFSGWVLAVRVYMLLQSLVNQPHVLMARIDTI